MLLTLQLFRCIKRASSDKTAPTGIDSHETLINCCSLSLFPAIPFFLSFVLATSLVNANRNPSRPTNNVEDNSSSKGIDAEPNVDTDIKRIVNCDNRNDKRRNNIDRSVPRTAIVWVLLLLTIFLFYEIEFILGYHF